MDHYGKIGRKRKESTGSGKGGVDPKAALASGTDQAIQAGIGEYMKVMDESANCHMVSSTLFGVEDSGLGKT